MSHITSILVATDFSPDATNAATRAAMLAAEHGAALKLLHVVHSDLLTELFERLKLSGEVVQHVLEQAESKLDALAREIAPVAKRTPECLVRTGNVLDEILAAADYADVFLLGAHGLRRGLDLLIGTSAERLLRKSRRPMIVIKQTPQSTYRRVLVPVDFSVHSMAALRFAQEIVPSVDIHVFHAYECPYEGKLRQADVPEDVIETYRLQYRNQALENMENLIEKTDASLARTTTSVELGEAKFLVANKAASWGADLIVIGKHGRSALGEFFLGGVTRHTVSRARCDVAVVPEWARL